VRAAHESARERGARVDSRRLLADALGPGLCETTYTAVRSEFEARLAAGDLRDVLRERGPADRVKPRPPSSRTRSSKRRRPPTPRPPAR
jgi:hypothetical protein